MALLFVAHPANLSTLDELCMGLFIRRRRNAVRSELIETFVPHYSQQHANNTHHCNTRAEGSEQFCQAISDSDEGHGASCGFTTGYQDEYKVLTWC